MRFEELRNTLVLLVGKGYEVPMSMIDGRPWVPTAAEADVDGEDLSHV